MSETEGDLEPWATVKLYRTADGKIVARIEHEGGAIETKPDYLSGAMAKVGHAIVEHVKWS